MPEKSNDGLFDLFRRIGISGKQLQNAKLGPGVVGRNSKIGHTFLVVALVGVIGGSYIRNAPIIGISLVGGFLIALCIPLLNVIFGHKNPAAAILEGAQFLQYQQIEMAAKGRPAILSSTPPAPKPKELQGGNVDAGGGQET
jgi:hypothetical protein